ncbi:hypothetical protein EDD93_0592 [Streptomyces sp. 840.1]|nr:hypothetical protein EDD93_0592 [Streptomyces sp. 840.1]
MWCRAGPGRWRYRREVDEETQRPEAAGAQSGAGVVCALCGTGSGSDSAPPTWLCSVEHGSRRYFCDNCARTHIRAIEGRLGSDWW